GPFTVGRRPVNHTRMKTNYPTAQAGSQYRAAAPETRKGEPAQILARTSRTSLRIPSGLVTDRPRLIGNPQMLRELRAAEMAAWEAIRPSTKLEARPPCQRQTESLWRLALNAAPKKDAWVLFVLALCAAAAVGVGLCDISRLVQGWSHFVEGLHNF